MPSHTFMNRFKRSRREMHPRSWLRLNVRWCDAMTDGAVDNEEHREVTQKEGLSVAYKYKCPFVEVSAKTGENVDMIFQEIVREVRKARLLPTASLNHPHLHLFHKHGVLYRLKEGMVKSWKRIWVGLSKDGNLLFYNSQKDFQENKVRVSMPLLTTTVKPVTIKDKKNTFAVISIFHTFQLQADSPQDMLAWMDQIQEGIAAQLNTVTSVKEMNNSQDRTPEEEWRLVQKVSPGNTLCADCTAPDPDWCSINLGLLICIQCSGVHRSLGVHISKVRSMTLDKLDPEVYEFLKAVGNTKANDIWEKELPSDGKPLPKDSRAKKESFIKAKYLDKKFVGKSALTAPEMREAVEEALTQGHLSQAMLLIIQGAHPEEPHPTSLCTPLHTASLHNHLMCGVWLTLWGVNLGSVNKEGLTALDLARRQNHTSLDTWLTKRDAPAQSKPEAPPSSAEATPPASPSVGGVVKTEQGKWVKPSPRNRPQRTETRFQLGTAFVPMNLSATLRRSRGGTMGLWAVIVRSPHISLRITVDPNASASAVMDSIRPKFEEDTSQYSLFVETSTAYILLDKDSILRSFQQIQTNSGLLFRETSFTGKPGKAVTKAGSPVGVMRPHDQIRLSLSPGAMDKLSQELAVSQDSDPFTNTLEEEEVEPPPVLSIEQVSSPPPSPSPSQAPPSPSQSLETDVQVKPLPKLPPGRSHTMSGRGRGGEEAPKLPPRRANQSFVVPSTRGRGSPK
eukprot:TRINITY_DN4499_c0_g1_i2.p1 TRINITY_DN4499_c0_g1~~TRINITY_DN4499_c0_g1_i2.p1  ORF type:complete len:734 (-),score=179.05 TRINITY_DN4499_c0_g1_i2:52-2253(-)